MATEMVVFPVTLEGLHVRLEPLAKAHLKGLAEIGLDEELWQWIPTPVRTAEEMAAYIEAALDEQERQVSLPFALVEKASGRAIGSTRYGNIDRRHHRVEIGWTWVAREWQRTATNTEAKYLLLKHARSDTAYRRAGRGHFSKPHDYCKRTHPAYGLLQHYRFRVADGESAPRRETGRA